MSMIGVNNMHIYVSRTFNCIYFLDEKDILKELPTRIGSYPADLLKDGDISIIKGRKNEPIHNRLIRKQLLLKKEK